jgi:tetratricopeptide (TPR) repeat protein
MNLKKALLFLCALSAAVLSLNAQPVTMSTSGNGYFYRGSLMQDLRNYVGSSHQLDHLNKYLLPQWNQEAEAEYIKAVNEFELGNASSLTMLEDFIENHKYEPLAMVARAKLGDYYFYHGDYEQALLNYEQVREKALDDDSDENVLYRPFLRGVGAAWLDSCAK